MKRFEVGDEVIYTPTWRTVGYNGNTPLSTMRPGGRYRVASLYGNRLQGVVVEPYADGTNHTAFELVNGRADMRHLPFLGLPSEEAGSDYALEHLDGELAGAIIEVDGKLSYSKEQIIIDALIASSLTLIAGRDGGWTLLYRSTVTGDFWELSYPRLVLGFVGPRKLRKLNLEMAGILFGLTRNELAERRFHVSGCALTGSQTSKDTTREIRGELSVANGFAITKAGDTFFVYGYLADAPYYENGLSIDPNRFPGPYWSFIGTTLSGLTGREAQRGLSLPQQFAPPNCVYKVTPPQGTPFRFNPAAFPQYGYPGGYPEYYFLKTIGADCVSRPLSIAIGE